MSSVNTSNSNAGKMMDAGAAIGSSAPGPLGAVARTVTAANTALAEGGHRTTGGWLSQGTDHRTPRQWLAQGNHRPFREWLSGAPSKNK